MVTVTEALHLKAWSLLRQDKDKNKVAPETNFVYSYEFNEQPDRSGVCRSNKTDSLRKEIEIEGLETMSDD